MPTCLFCKTEKKEGLWNEWSGEFFCSYDCLNGYEAGRREMYGRACDYCDRYEFDSDGYWHDGFFFCSMDCREKYIEENEEMYTCAQCGREVYESEGCWDDDDNFFCDCFCREDYCSCIYDYDYTPDYYFYSVDEESDIPFFGVELEADYGNEKDAAARDVTFGDLSYVKHDGSLTDDGIEIVTHPCSLRYHLEQFPWDEILSSLADYGFRSHDTSTCGLHVHISRSAFGETSDEQDLTAAKVIIMIDHFWNDSIVPFSRRDYSRLDDWACKPDCNYTPDDSECEIFEKTNDLKSNGRYQAVNLTNPHTIEFRFFRGTLRKDTIFASLQLLDLLLHVAKENDLQTVYSMTWKELTEDVSRYPELREYLEIKNLL